MKFKKIYLFLLLIMFLGIYGYCSLNKVEISDRPPETQTEATEQLTDETENSTDTSVNLPTVGQNTQTNTPTLNNTDTNDTTENLLNEDTNLDENKNDVDVDVEIEPNIETEPESETTTQPGIYIPFFGNLGSTSSGGSSDSNSNSTTDKTKDQLEAMMNEAVAQSMMTISMNANPIFTDGTGNLLIVNDAKNNYPQIVEIHTTSGVLIYQSGLIQVGNKVETATLQTQLAKGDHNCIATFNAINPTTGERLAQAKAQIQVTIK